MKQFLTSPKYQRSILWVGVVVLLLIAFQCGVFVGFHKASMALHSDARYQRAYGAHFTNGPLGLPQDDFPEAHGAAGRVLSVSLPTIVVEDNNTEKIVRVATDTVIRMARDLDDSTSIAANDFVVVIGTPNEKQEIVAKFIRVLPPPAGFTSSNSIQTSTSSTN